MNTITTTAAVVAPFTINALPHVTSHGVTVETLDWAIREINPTTGFFIATLTLPEGHADLRNNLYGPACGDLPVAGETLVRDAGDEYRGATPFVNLPPRPTRLITIVGIMGEDRVATIFTAYGGPLAERIPSDPSLAGDEAGIARATKFWAEHALSIAARA